MCRVSPKPIPEDLVGVWRRISLAIGDDPPSENSRVVWIQARARFADIRTPAEGAPGGVEPMSFAGHSSWDAPRLTFHHAIDLGAPSEDVGALSWRGEELVESGEIESKGQNIAFEEVWRRTPLGGDALLALEAQNEQLSSGRSHSLRGALVRLGAHAIVIADRRPRDFDYAAAYLRYRSARWEVQWSIGDVQQLPLPPEPAETAEEGASLELAIPGLATTSRWLVVERGVVPGGSARD